MIFYLMEGEDGQMGNPPSKNTIMDNGGTPSRMDIYYRVTLEFTR